MDLSCDADQTHRLLLFGPQALSFDATAFSALRSTVALAPDSTWVTETIAELSTCWSDFVTAFPKYGIGHGHQELIKLREWWSQVGTCPEVWPSHLPNIILSPLLVIAHLGEYSEYISPSLNEPSSQQIESLGFCIGVLSALAVALSRDPQRLQIYGPRATRLAMLIGGIVDAQGYLDNNGPARSLATAWMSLEAKQAMDQVLARFPEAYVSVSYDERRATVTVAERSLSLLQRELRNAGVVANEIGLFGRFHSPCYRDDIESVIRFCDARTDLSLSDTTSLMHPLRGNGGDVVTTHQGGLHGHALRTILIDHSDWYGTMKALANDTQLRLRRPVVKVFGPEPCVTPSLARLLEWKSGENLLATKSDDIAVVGMGIKVAGADDLVEFWDLLCSSTSQHREVDAERIPFDTAETKRKWFANLINDPDAFDHKFFKKSAREVASMDPQQRLLLQVAYQALEQAGYFSTPGSNEDKNIGCYVGVCAADYEQNVACHEPNAFTATGNLKSFIAGKVSHYFGWTGPGLCVDTACSSSLVAVHLACKAILSGECHAALAGGVNVMTSPQWFRNLAAASFLSPTGQCKPFDASADGYCRGEGIAAVYLKSVSAALANGDQILGVISSSAVLQNENCTPIFVPNAPSLSNLFSRVLAQSKLKPSQISVVEAHGTGTQVGDPAEYQSIKQALGSTVRTGSEPLLLGSVKGLVGHTECTSGAVSLIKTILMVQHKAIPGQASFDTLNPHLNATSSDGIEIATKFRKWTSNRRAVLINNYGASGSNASMIVTQAPLREIRLILPLMEYPFRLCGRDLRALRENSAMLQLYLSGAGEDSGHTIADLSFAVCRQSNPTLEHGFVFGSRTRADVVKTLEAFTKGQIDVSSVTKPSQRPVILCFGGQISSYVGLAKVVYETVAVFRGHLETCDTVSRSLGYGSIFPTIFERTPIHDPVKLQTSLFASQYACAKSWMDCGLKPIAVVGHSFGELTALCVSGVLSLAAAFKLIAGRAEVIRDSWGPEKGCMMAVEATLEIVEKALAEARLVCEKAGEEPPTLACVNGSRSFTLAATSRAIDMTADMISQNPAFSTIKFKKLSVSHAFHSTLVQPLMCRLSEVGRQLTFAKPNIHIERALELPASGTFTSDYVAEHMRNPVYFHQAVGRLAKQHPNAVWLEAGSNSTITNMASRALNATDPSLMHFQAINLSSDAGLQLLANATKSLWKEGLTVTFWLHYRAQTYDYKPLMLPPYQFEKTKHWVEYKLPTPASRDDKISQEHERLKGIWTFSGYLDDVKQSARFRVNTTVDEYIELVSGHVIARTAPICPATLEVKIAVDALMSLVYASDETSKVQPKVTNVENLAPLCLDPLRSVWLDVASADVSRKTWNWKIVSSAETHKSETLHVQGTVSFISNGETAAQSEFSGYERLIAHQRCQDILDHPDADDIIKGRNIYTAFSGVVDYPESYRGVQKLVGKGMESAGRIIKQRANKPGFDAVLGDCFSQVGGIWVNCMTNAKPQDMYIATGFDKWMRSPAPCSTEDYPDQDTWDVFATHHRESDQAMITDIFVFEPRHGKLIEVILGIRYHKILKDSMSKILHRLSSPTKSQDTLSKTFEPDKPTQPASVESQSQTSLGASTVSKGTDIVDITDKTRALLADISGLEPESIQSDTQLADIGIDSLMAMELARELEILFRSSLSVDGLMNVVVFGDLVRFIQETLGVVVASDTVSTLDSTSSVVPSKVSARFSESSTPPTSISDGEDNNNICPSTPGQALPDLHLSASAVLEAFAESKNLTDRFIGDHRCSGYIEQVLPKQTQLCVALTVEAFERLGCSLRQVTVGERIKRIPHVPQQQLLVGWLYKMLEQDGRLIDIEGDSIVRTAVSLPSKQSHELLALLQQDFPDHDWANRLTFFAGSRLADVLSGKVDGIKLIFGSDEGRELVAGLYGSSLLNKLANVQMQDIITRVASKIQLGDGQGPLKILELGAGTGGTTKGMVALLTQLDIPVEYTFTDLSGSFVASARRDFKEYPFMRYRVHDIEKSPAEDLIGTQHIVIASNAIHATHDLRSSLRNVRKALRPDGFLMMLEMTEPVVWVDIIFGLFEGWWLFEDGRQHAIASQLVWERELHAAGYGHVDWTDGHSPEVKIQRVMVALASGTQYNREPLLPLDPASFSKANTLSQGARRAAVDAFITKHTQGFEPISLQQPTSEPSTPVITGQSILITGASGSLGTHLVAHMAALPQVTTVVCLNRRSTARPEDRQYSAMEERGILLDAACQSKLRVIQTDIRKAKLGLVDEEYEALVTSITHVVHNAWPMSGKRSLSSMEPQFSVMRNLIDFARDVAIRGRPSAKLVFQFISSISVVGHYSKEQNRTDTKAMWVPEERVALDAVLFNGYSEAKFVCERMLDETLHRCDPTRIRAMAVRLGQVAGSRLSGYWNNAEHLPFLLKSSQTLRVLPLLDGDLCWTPLEDVAGTLVDLLRSAEKDGDKGYPVFHIDNPVRQQWSSMLPVIADALSIPQANMVPFEEWIRRVKAFPGAVERDNPAALLVDFLDDNFVRMSCGGLLLDTTKARAFSPTLAAVVPVSDDVVRKYVKAWKEVGFLH